MVGKELQRILRVSYCLDYTDFCEFYGKDNFYTMEKWEKFRDSFTRWYCELDDSNAERYLEFIKDRK